MVNVHVCYNVFDNEELLEYSIDSIRESVSEISVLFQEVSNFGQKAEDGVLDFLKSLKDSKKIDNLMLFTPELSKGAFANELRKNQITYDFSKKKKYDYHMVMACDEFYFREEFEKLKQMVSETQVDQITSYMYTYYKSSKYRFKEIENYVVPIMHKVHQDNRNFQKNAPAPLLIDPTRKMNYDSCICLSKHTPLMHHLSHVRKNYRKKLENSTANVNWSNNIDKFVKDYETWIPSEEAYIFGVLTKLEYTDRFAKEITF